MKTAEVITPPRAGTGLYRTIPGIMMVLAVLLAALTWGGHRPLPSAAITGMLLSAFCVQMVFDREDEQATELFRHLQLPALLFIGVLLWAAVQSLPFPLNMAHPAWAALPAEATTGTGALSVDPDAGWAGIMRLSGIAAALWIAARMDAEVARLTLVASVTVGVCIASYGLVTWAAGANPLTGPPAYPGVVTGTFINRNAFACFAALSALGAFSLASQCSSARIFFGSAGVILATALILSGSRAGAAAFAAGFVVLIVLTQPRTGRIWRLGLLAVVLGLLVIAAVTAPVLAERLADTNVLANKRIAIWELILQMIADRPLTGHGLGAFQDGFRTYLTAPVSAAEWDFAHSAPLELSAELGIPATAALFLGLGLLVRQAVKALRHPHGALAIAAAVTAALHGLVDFAPQLPANTLMVAILLGFGLAARDQSRI